MTDMSAALENLGSPGLRARVRAILPHIGHVVTIAAPLGLLLVAGQVLPATDAIVIAIALVALAGTVVATMRHARAVTAIRELHAARRDLNGRMQLDPLTGLLNRAAFHDVLDGLDTEQGGPVSILFFDLDRFKDVNDTLGHRVGDGVLIEVARRSQPVLAGAIGFSRLGGDEFAAILSHDPLRPPESVGRELVAAICAPLMIDGKMVDVGASVGIAVGHPEIDGAQELLRRADIAMYEAKASRNGACRIFDDVLDNRQSMEGAIRVELGHSIIREELSLLYQPVIDARSGEVASVEALLRWKSGQIGDVSPATLIPIAEESGHIVELTEWTLDTALSAIREFDDVGVAVNISPVYFRHNEFVHRIFDRLLAAQVRPDLLTLEITEGVLISNIESARQAISRLRDIGVKVFLDDFGTGYSSLSYLQHFTLDGLKLDKSFLRNVGERRQATQIIRTMINFGHSLDMKVVVEGVENDWQARLLQLLGCDLMQGFELGVPMSIADIKRMRAAGGVTIGSDAQTEAENRLSLALRSA